MRSKKIKAKYGQAAPAEKPAKGKKASKAKAKAGVCRICGCTEDHACLGPDGKPCHWVEPNLCSACFQQDADLDEDVVEDPDDEFQDEEDLDDEEADRG